VSRDVAVQLAVAWVFLEPAVDRLARRDEPAVPTEVLERHDVGVDDLARVLGWAYWMW